MRPRRWASLAVTGLVAAGLTGCAGADHPDVVVIEVTGSGFSPAAVTIAPGDEVRWINRTPRRTSVSSSAEGPEGLTGTPDGADPFSSGPLREGETFSTRLDTPGTYVYWSDEQVQQDWIGSIEVEESS